MIIALASTSSKKVDAVKLAFGESVNLIARKVESGVNEQPIGDETMQGADNRIEFLKAALPTADFFISIENGLFKEAGQYVDRAVVTIEDKSGNRFTTLSEGVVFPTEFVEKTREREGGFEKWTVGKTMMEAGIVSDDGDPHKDLDPEGRSRVYFLNQAVQAAKAKIAL
ncbi:MAG: hypothetical protein CMP22_08495 [Rickettsiales bacterium]|nr:hypothetical protein [Rickettsiales bacterium]|tara:strand:+ start:214 stop:720 length:507 start_codon:yes stop_codon:yes gene_type:complete